MASFDIFEEAALRRRLPAPALRRAIREAAGASQQRLADEVGVSRPTLTRWEDGSRRPAGQNLAKYVAALDALRSALVGPEAIESSPSRTPTATVAEALAVRELERALAELEDS